MIDLRYLAWRAREKGMDWVRHNYDQNEIRQAVEQAEEALQILKPLFDEERIS